eukprot:5438311-Pyramimonas_sp.AAC.1
MRAVDACDRNHSGRRWDALRDREACERVPEVGAVSTCERSHWGRRWGSLWGRDKCDGACQMWCGGRM